MVDGSSFRKRVTSTGKRGLTIGILKNSKSSSGGGTADGSNNDLTVGGRIESKQRLEHSNIISQQPNQDESDFLWEELGRCIDYSWNTKSVCKNIAETLQEWATIEKEASKRIPAMRNKILKSKCETEILGIAWENFIKGVDDISFQRSNYASAVSQLSKELNDFKCQQTKLKAVLQQEGVKLKNELEKYQLLFKRAEQRYKKACEDSNHCIDALEKASISRESKSVQEQKINKSLFLVRYSEDQYKLALEELELYQCTYNKELKNVIEKLQSLEAERIDFMKEILSKTLQAQQEAIDSYQKTTSTVMLFVDQIDSKKDVEATKKQHLKVPMRSYECKSFTTAKLEERLRQLRIDDCSLQEHRETEQHEDHNAGRRNNNITSTIYSENVSLEENPAGPQMNNDDPIRNEMHEETLDCENELQPVPPLTSAELLKSKHDLKILSPNSLEEQYVRVLYDYEGQDTNELSLYAGEIIRVIEMDQSGWWDGENSLGEEGMFPRNYVELIPVNTEESLRAAVDFKCPNIETPTVNSRSEIAVQPSHSYDVNDETSEVDINDQMNKRTTISNTSDLGEEIKEQNDDVLEADTEALIQEHEPPLFPRKPKDERVVVLYDYEGEDEHDLSVKREQVLFVHGMDNDGGWLDASDLATGRRGMVPSNYVKFIQTA